MTRTRASVRDRGYAAHLERVRPRRTDATLIKQTVHQPLPSNNPRRPSLVQVPAVDGQRIERHTPGWRYRAGLIHTGRATQAQEVTAGQGYAALKADAQAKGFNMAWKHIARSLHRRRKADEPVIHGATEQPWAYSADVTADDTTGSSAANRG